MAVGRTAHCWSCGSMLPANGFGRSDVCFACAKDTRVCLNCRFHDPGSYNECRESVAERIVDKEKSNFCEYFKSKGSQPRMEIDKNNHKGSGKSAGNGKSDGHKGQISGSAARAAAEALFKRN